MGFGIAVGVGVTIRVRIRVGVRVRTRIRVRAIVRVGPRARMLSQLATIFIVNADIKFFLGETAIHGDGWRM